jgi:hypothetical protein
MPIHIKEIIRLEGGNEYREGKKPLQRSHWCLMLKALGYQEYTVSALCVEKTFERRLHTHTYTHMYNTDTKGRPPRQWPPEGQRSVTTFSPFFLAPPPGVRVSIGLQVFF